MQERIRVKTGTVKRLSRWMPRERTFHFVRDLQRSDLCMTCGGTGETPWRPGWGYTCPVCRGVKWEGARLTTKELDALDQVGPDRFIREYAHIVDDQNLKDWKHRKKQRKAFEDYRSRLDANAQGELKHALMQAEENQMTYNRIPSLGRVGSKVEIEGVVMSITTGIRPAVTGFGKTSWYLTTIKLINGHEVIYWNKFDGVKEGNWVKVFATIKLEGKHSKTGVRRTEIIKATLISCETYAGEPE